MWLARRSTSGSRSGLAAASSDQTGEVARCAAWLIAAYRSSTPASDHSWNRRARYERTGNQVGDAVESNSQRFARLGTGGRLDEGGVAIGDPFERHNDKTVLVLEVVGGEAERYLCLRATARMVKPEMPSQQYRRDRLEDAFPLAGRGSSCIRPHLLDLCRQASIGAQLAGYVASLVARQPVGQVDVGRCAVRAQRMDIAHGLCSGRCRRSPKNGAASVST